MSNAIQPKKSAMRDAPWTVAAAIDIFFIILFIFIGTRNHDSDTGAGGFISTVLPFLIGLACGWLALKAFRKPFRLPTGIGLWGFTVVIGMALRHFAWDRGTAGSFIVVATVFNAFTLVGWRFLWESVRDRGN